MSSSLASAEAPDPQPKCPVCEVTIVDGDIVVFEHGGLVHLDCYWDPPIPRRGISRAMLWPR